MLRALKTKLDKLLDNMKHFIDTMFIEKKVYTIIVCIEQKRYNTCLHIKHSRGCG